MILMATASPFPAVTIVCTLTPAIVPAAQIPSLLVRPSLSTLIIVLILGSVPGVKVKPIVSARLLTAPVANKT